MLTDDQLYCPRCGTERGRLCERCRNPLHPSWEYCPGCGAGPFKHGEEDTPATDESDACAHK
ncbi:double zinc ribbon domain-containing protein [Paenibacillus dendritiformis]|uniref:double zinc ribbon domain-containing protein n=1 Tax=Paenibacillus dendritiformis TaxID=130049 RepID=UPI003B97CF22